MEWNLMNLIILIIYLAGLVYVGVVAERGSTGSATGFLLAKREATLPWIIMSIFATGIGTLAYIGTVGMIASGGVVDLWFEYFYVVGMPILTILFVRKLRTSGIISLWDSIAFRFGPLTTLLYGIFYFIAVPFSLAAVLKGAGITFVDMFPILKGVSFVDPISLGALIVLMVIGAYLCFGGFKACLVTDMFQGVLTWFAMVVPTIVVFYVMGDGSFQEGWHKIVEHFIVNGKENFLYFSKVIGPDAPSAQYTYSAILAFAIMDMLMRIIPSPNYGPRYMAAKNEKVARQGPILAMMLVMLPYGLIINVTGLAFIAYAPEIVGDGLFTGVLQKLSSNGIIPPIVSSLLLISLLAAVMGTLDSLLMSRMSEGVRGFYNLWINPEANDKQLVRASRIVLLIIVLIAAVTAFALPPSIWFIDLAFKSVIGPLMFVMAIAVFLVKRATWQGAIIGALTAGCIAFFLSAVRTGFYGQYEWMKCAIIIEHWPSWLHSQFFTYPLGLLMFFVISRLQAPQRPEHLERFFSLKQVAEYVLKYGFDRPYVTIKGSIPEELKQYEIKKYRNQTRIYAEEEDLKKLAEQYSLKFWPVYVPYESWNEVFDRRIKGMYEFGLDVVKQRDEDYIHTHERNVAKVIGGLAILVSLVVYFMMCWWWPMRWRASIVMYIIGSILMFGGFSIFYEDYHWCRKFIDLFTKTRIEDVR